MKAISCLTSTSVSSYISIFRCSFTSFTSCLALRQCWAIFGANPPMSSYFHVKTSTHSLISSIKPCSSFEVMFLLINIGFGFWSSSVLIWITWSSIGDSCCSNHNSHWASILWAHDKGLPLKFCSSSLAVWMRLCWLIIA